MDRTATSRRRVAGKRGREPFLLGFHTSTNVQLGNLFRFWLTLERLERSACPERVEGKRLNPLNDLTYRRVLEP